jgi:RNA polymerase sigma-70 factor (ECF subfamily)
MNEVQQETVTKVQGANVAGARTEFEELIGVIRPELHRYCSRMTGSVVDGEDVVQETLTKAFAALAEGPEIPNLRAWLFRIAHNKAVDYTRDYARRYGDSLEDHPELGSQLSPLSPLDARLAAQAGLRPFVSLPPAQRAAVILKDVLGYSLEEIADVLGRTVAMVKGVLHRGRVALRAVLEDPALETAKLNTPQTALLEEYVRHFNAREFDRLREMLAADASLDVVGVTKAHGASDTGQYFGRYAKVGGWALRMGLVEGRPAVLVFSSESDPAPQYFILVEWSESRIVHIRDFRYVAYIMEDCRWSVVAA